MKFALSILFLLMVFLGCKNSEKKEVDTTTLEESSTALEQHRPVYHFTPPSMWCNDPNGLVYKDGEYHLFYQHYPDDIKWGPMHWGHAISTDLVNWEHLPIALYPDEKGYIFSGSSVVDHDNTSGLGTEDNPPMVAIYSYHDMDAFDAGSKDYETQAIAYSLDNGRTFTKYKNNPVIENPGVEDFRDPKVIWHEPTQKWVMIVAAKSFMKLYNSSDLINWNHISDFGEGEGNHGEGWWECPDFFPLKVENSEKEYWVMVVNLNGDTPNGGSGTQYFIGEFDGTKFTNSNPSDVELWYDYGRDNFASVSWSDIPKEDGRRIILGWMSNWDYARKVPTENWRNAMTLPRYVTLRDTEKGIRLIANPVKELEKLRNNTVDFGNLSLSNQKSDLTSKIPFKTSVSEIEFKIQNIDSISNMGLEFSNSLGEKIIFGLDSAKNQFYVDRSNSGKSDFHEGFEGVHYAPRISEEKEIKIQIFKDVSSMEVFIDDGEVVMTTIFFPNEDFNMLNIFSNNGNTELSNFKIHSMN